MPHNPEPAMDGSTGLPSILKLSTSSEAQAAKRCSPPQLRRAHSSPSKIESRAFSYDQNSSFLPRWRLYCEMKSAIRRSLETSSLAEVAAAHRLTLVIPRIKQLIGTNEAVLGHTQILLSKHILSLQQDYPPLPDHVYRQGGDYLAREYLFQQYAMRFAVRKASVHSRKRSNSLSSDVMRDIGLRGHSKKKVVFKPEPIVPSKSPTRSSRKRKREPPRDLSSFRAVDVLILPCRSENLTSHSLIKEELLKVNPLANDPENTSLYSYFFMSEVQSRSEYKKLRNKALSYLDRRRPIDDSSEMVDEEVESKELVQTEGGWIFF